MYAIILVRKPDMTNKILRGQFFTTSNPFENSNAFSSWFSLLPEDAEILEPFAGAGNLFDYLPESKWVGYDIEPKHPDVIEQDTIKNFPKDYKVCITNPPYLAKTTCTRKNLPVQPILEDLYLDCIKLALDNCDYVCAIIPSTFIGTKLFADRLYAWDKIDYVLFSDTDKPVGVAYFVPNKVNTTKYYVNGEEILITADDTPETKDLHLEFNVSHGNYVLCAIDLVSQDNIKIYKEDSSFNRSKFLKNTSRNYSLFYCPDLKDEDIDGINEFITKWRERTKDFFITSFKSEQKSGKYRKRFSFGQFKWVVSQYLKEKNA